MSAASVLWDDDEPVHVPNLRVRALIVQPSLIVPDEERDRLGRQGQVNPLIIRDSFARKMALGTRKVRPL